MCLLLFVYLPIMVTTEANCLKKGYPKYEVTIDLERYCLKIEGAITTVIERQQ